MAIRTFKKVDDSKNAIERARRNIRKDRLNKYIDKATPKIGSGNGKGKATPKAGHGNGIDKATPKTGNGNGIDKATSKTGNGNDKNNSALALAELSSSATNARQNKTLNYSAAAPAQDDLIDSALLNFLIPDSSMEKASDDEIDLFEIVNGDDIVDSVDSEDDVQALFNNLDYVQPEQDAYGFINMYSKINVVAKQAFASEWVRYKKSAKFDDSIGKVSCLAILAAARLHLAIHARRRLAALMLRL
jgi:hypothetical protein